MGGGCASDKSTGPKLTDPELHFMTTSLPGALPPRALPLTGSTYPMFEGVLVLKKPYPHRFLETETSIVEYVEHPGLAP